MLQELHTNGRDVEPVLDEMSERSSNHMDLDDLLPLDFVRYLTADPWFTSLWTL